MRNDIATIWAHCMLCFHGLCHQVSPWPQVIKHHHGLKSSSITMASGIKHHLSSQLCEMNITTICRHCTLCFHSLSHQVSPLPQSSSITMASVIKYHHGLVIKHYHGLSHQVSPWPQSSSITMASVIKYHHGLVIKHHHSLSHQASPWPQSPSITCQVNHARWTLLQSAASAHYAFTVSVIKYHLQDQHHYNLPPPPPPTPLTLDFSLTS